MILSKEWWDSFCNWLLEIFFVEQELIVADFFSF